VSALDTRTLRCARGRLELQEPQNARNIRRWGKACACVKVGGPPAYTKDAGAKAKKTWSPRRVKRPMAKRLMKGVARGVARLGSPSQPWEGGKHAGKGKWEVRGPICAGVKEMAKTHLSTAPGGMAKSHEAETTLWESGTLRQTLNKGKVRDQKEPASHAFLPRSVFVNRNRDTTSIAEETLPSGGVSTKVT